MKLFGLAFDSDSWYLVNQNPGLYFQNHYIEIWAQSEH